MKTLFFSNMSKSRRLTSTFFSRLRQKVQKYNVVFLYQVSTLIDYAKKYSDGENETHPPTYLKTNLTQDLVSEEGSRRLQVFLILQFKNAC